MARLLLASAKTCQIIVVSHSGALIDALGESEQARSIALAKDMGETRVSGQRFGPDWRWPKR